jgi:hypothetical protein
MASNTIPLDRGRENIYIESPIGVDPLPAEWEKKLGNYTFREAVMAVLDDVYLCGPAGVGIKDDDVVLDTAYFGRFDLFERNMPYFHAAMKVINNGSMPETFSSAISLLSVWSHNYFHWVLDLLPRVLSVNLEKMQMDALLPYDNPGFIYDSLEIYEQGKGYWVFDPQKPHQVLKLWIPINGREKGRVRPSTIKKLREYGNKFKDYIETDKRWLYVSRTGANTRRVTNKQTNEFRDFTFENDIEVVMPEVFPFNKQINMFKSAEIIIGPHGSGLINAIWSDHKPAVIELVTPEYTNPCCWLACAAAGCKYGYVVCEPDGSNEDMFVDVNKLDKVLEMIH